MHLQPGTVRVYFAKEENHLPLSGTGIVDLTRIRAGPSRSLLLADTGAEVVKIETPGIGDPGRRQGAIRDGLDHSNAEIIDPVCRPSTHTVT